MKNLAIIPARGGSKRIPRKNIKSFLGKPIIAYAIEAALQSELFDEVMVSTDDNEIAKTAAQYGAKVPFMRSSENADDFASTADVVIEVLNNYKAQNTVFEYVCCIYPTAVLISKEILLKAYSKLITKEVDSVLPVVKFSYPPQRGLKFTNGKISMISEQYKKTRSQDLEPIYHDAGQFYWAKPDNVICEKRLIAKNTGAVILSELQVQDIDNPSDWELAVLKYKLMNKKEQ